MEKEKLEIPVEKLKDYGFREQDLNDEVVVSCLEAGLKTPLLNAKAELPNGKSILVPMRINLYKSNDGIEVAVHPVQKGIYLKQGKNELSPQEVNRLENGEQFIKEWYLGDKAYPSLIAADSQTKEILYRPLDWIHVPEKILGQEVPKNVAEKIKAGSHGYMFDLESKFENKNGEKPIVNVKVFYDLNKNHGNGGLSVKKLTPDELAEIREKSQGQDESKKTEKVPTENKKEVRAEMNIPEGTSTTTHKKGRGI